MLDKYFMKHTYTFFFTILFTGCSTYLLSDPTTEAATIEVNKNNPLIQANDYLGYHEDTHRAEIEEFTGVDPVTIPLADKPLVLLEAAPLEFLFAVKSPKSAMFPSEEKALY